ncbi:unnamed protein product [Ixodes persulcatus]
MFGTLRCLSTSHRFLNVSKSFHRTFVTLRSWQTTSPQPTVAAASSVLHQQHQPRRPSHKKTGLTSPVLPLNKVGDQKWTTIFHYPHIKSIRMLIRVKVYQTIGTLVVSPVLVAAEYMNWLNTDFSQAAVVLSFTASFVLLAMGYLAERVVGVMYVNEDRSLLRVGHMDFWGNRHDHVFRTKDVAEFADSGQHWSALYITLRRYSAPNDPLYLSLKHGGIVEDKLFREVFGNEV